MKKTLLSLSLYIGISGISQVVNDQVSVQQGYANQVYYSLENGEIANIPNNDWDLAFDVSAFGSAIRTNNQMGTNLYVASTDTADWANLDTTGFATWTPLYNSDKTWAEGAFNADADANNPVDLGWGLYNSTTHFITGNKLFVIELPNGDVKKVWIKLLASGTYTFTVADLDNSNQSTQAVIKSDYAGKNFVYYAIGSQQIIDREPLSSNWDIVFTKYVAELGPGTYYGVTGALTNHSITTFEANSALGPDIDFDYTFPYENDINIMGYDWKAYSFSAGGYVLDDSLAYFVQTSNGDTWKIIYTGFTGSSTGDIMFSKEQVGFVNIDNHTAIETSVYPNPTTDQITITGTSEISQITLITMGGQLVNQTPVNSTQTQLSLADLNAGIYFLNIATANGEVITKKIVKQ